MLVRNLLGSQVPGPLSGWGCQGCGGLATCLNLNCLESPSPHLHLKQRKEGLTCSLAVLPAGPPGAALWPCRSVSAQQGVWGILVSDSGVCGVLAGSPAVWASWEAASFSQGVRARPPPVMKATLSGPGWGGGSLGGLRVTAQGSTLPLAHLGLVPCTFSPLSPCGG